MSNPVAKSGFPDHDPRSKIANTDDAKIVDEKGLAVVQGAPWSSVGTGKFLTIAHIHSSKANIAAPGGMVHAVARVTPHVVVALTGGRATFDTEFFGASLELPADLGDDPLKRQYVGEWIGGTWAEIVVAKDLDREKAVSVVPGILQAAEAQIANAGF